MKNINRREFVKKSVLSASAVPFISPISSILWASQENKLPIHIFSKHLQFLDYRSAGEIAAKIGFAGLDLTVRPNGHVLPKDVEKVLPKAITDIKKGGSSCSLMTTAIESVRNERDMAVLKTAATLGIKFYRSNWFNYNGETSMPEALLNYQQEVSDLSKINKELGLVGCYQNHAGTRVGASLWEVAKLLETADPSHFGVQYDIRHATVEGGLSWENGLKLIQEHIKTIVVKDFKWGLVDGEWTTVNTPIGGGMVDFKTYFGLLKKYNIQAPVILHMEYNLGGAEHGRTALTVDKKVVFEAMKKDLKKVQELWAEA
ncbi:sugar phosphate isomerase/epimerase [Saonia flava]|uniref:Sugar phosphate isomerase/epimerase n=1 Tax=Saonia flava TaxID=523696 RepID=A0A846QL79_9FLAO|nr:TIM barrel protein [Saonia flava]NJB69716.1 sugar phosphate isomerase/epimerase [Saonia flava]